MNYHETIVAHINFDFSTIWIFLPTFARQDSTGVRGLCERALPGPAPGRGGGEAGFILFGAGWDDILLPWGWKSGGWCGWDVWVVFELVGVTRFE